MAQSHVEDQLGLDRELRDSVMLLQRQRRTKLAIALFAIAFAIAAAFTGVYLQYNDELESTKDLGGSQAR